MPPVLFVMSVFQAIDPLHLECKLNVVFSHNSRQPGGGSVGDLETSGDSDYILT